MKFNGVVFSCKRVSDDDGSYSTDSPWEKIILQCRPHNRLIASTKPIPRYDFYRNLTQETFKKTKAVERPRQLRYAVRSLCSAF